MGASVEQMADYSAFSDGFISISSQLGELCVYMLQHCNGVNLLCHDFDIVSISRDLLLYPLCQSSFDQTFNFFGGQFLVPLFLSNISQLFLDFVTGGVILVVTAGKILKELCFLSGSFPLFLADGRCTVGEPLNAVFVVQLVTTSVEIKLSSVWLS